MNPRSPEIGDFPLISPSFSSPSAPRCEFRQDPLFRFAGHSCLPNKLENDSFENFFEPFSVIILFFVITFTFASEFFIEIFPGKTTDTIVVRVPLRRFDHPSTDNIETRASRIFLFSRLNWMMRSALFSSGCQSRKSRSPRWEEKISQVDFAHSGRFEHSNQLF